MKYEKKKNILLMIIVHYIIMNSVSGYWLVTD